jgi:hypothetical protein
MRGTGIHGNRCLIGGTIEVFTDYCHFLVLCISLFLPLTQRNMYFIFTGQDRPMVLRPYSVLV